MTSKLPPREDMDAAFTSAEAAAQKSAQDSGRPTDLELYRAIEHQKVMTLVMGQGYLVSVKPGKRGLEYRITPPRGRR